MSASFGKEYKLCSKERISELFEGKKSIKHFPFVLHYLANRHANQKTSFQIVISAPKRSFRKATERNRIKRLLRESVRKNKVILEQFLHGYDAHLSLFLVYTGKEEFPSTVLDKKMGKTFHELTKQLINENL